jgi:hypothetical protein
MKAPLEIFCDWGETLPPAVSKRLFGGVIVGVNGRFEMGSKAWLHEMRSVKAPLLQDAYFELLKWPMEDDFKCRTTPQGGELAFGNEMEILESAATPAEKSAAMERISANDAALPELQNAAEQWAKLRSPSLSDAAIQMWRASHSI